ncbi:hypothetical protein [Haladaptatus cibarius]|uniref:hypothetical protein n=1 Tax=Haladaptatus cibarius TaxID=453847 RepID=UPI000678D3A7|nr:hypothetical protein [Haladaptatus cibarius]
MERRTYLTGAATVLATLAGCTANGIKNIGTSQMRQITDVSVSGLESTDLSVEASVKQAKITSNHTGEISLTISWNGDEKRTLSFGSSIPYSSPKKSTKQEGVLLVDKESNFERRNTDTWIPKRDNLETGDLTLMGATLEPGQSVSHTWEVWAHPGKASRIESGTYTFTDSIRMGDSESVDWSLTVEIGGE